MAPNDQGTARKKLDREAEAWQVQGTKRLERVASRPREAERNGKLRPSVSAAATSTAEKHQKVLEQLWRRPMESETTAISRRPLFPSRLCFGGRKMFAAGAKLPAYIVSGILTGSKPQW